MFTAGHAQTPDKAKLDQYFDRLAEKNKAMGSLTIAKDGNVLYTRAIVYSQINGTERKPLTAATEYRIGSVTKMFTAAMILQLVEEGKLQLTDTLDCGRGTAGSCFTGGMLTSMTRPIGICDSMRLM
ncbi:MAG: serine hydrolase [Acidobacteria bacterium]|nr:serine hydrolase [Acidobacteriota bacterium]